eukprot:3214713-Pleurochrysis_carterae.AAC.3
MTPARVSSRLAPAQTLCARPRAKRRSAPGLFIGMPLKRSRNSGVICSAAQMPPGRNSAAWLRVTTAIEEKAAETRRSMVASPAASLRMRDMSRAARRARAVSLSLRTPSTTNSSLLLITAEGEAAVCSKKARAVGSIFGSTSRMCASEPIARSSIQRADSKQTRRRGPSRAPPP